MTFLVLALVFAAVVAVLAFALQRRGASANRLEGHADVGRPAESYRLPPQSDEYRR
jgi:hypothetical protein